MKKYAVIAPSENNPAPQGCFTNVKLPESCVIIDSMTIIFAPGAGTHVDFLVTLKGLRYVDGFVAEHTQNIEMADLAAVMSAYGHYKYRYSADLIVQNDYEDMEIKTKMYQIENIAAAMPRYIPPVDAHKFAFRSIIGECSDMERVYGKLEYIVNHTEPVAE